MQEKVLVVGASDYNSIFGESSERTIEVNEDSFLDYIHSNYKFLSRDYVEHDFKYKQIISYCLIKHKNSIFITRRKKTQSEKRLHNLFSVGIGGHINLFDTSGKDSVLVTGMQRELHEEVNIQSKYNYSLLGIINDNSTNVNRVHSGVCFIVELDEKNCEVKEKDKMDGKWIDISEVRMYYSDLEIWSRILVDSVF